MAYKLITSVPKKLEDEVNSLIKQGYEPIGGITIEIDEYNDKWYHQAMIKK